MEYQNATNAMAYVPYRWLSKAFAETYGSYTSEPSCRRRRDHNLTVTSINRLFARLTSNGMLKTWRGWEFLVNYSLGCNPSSYSLLHIIQI